MRWLVRIALLPAALLLPAVAAAVEPATACADAAAAAEDNWALPAGLIQAIGRAESGRVDPSTGHTTSWPWTVNANGSGFWFTSRTQAVDFVGTLQAKGVRLIDVGCFQVDLFYHPNAFASLDQAFDPAANADYAARFLSALHRRTGSWPTAIAGYHSGQPLEGETYRLRVMSQWAGVALTPGRTVTHDAEYRRPPAADRYVVLMSDAARAIHVIEP